MSANPLTPEEFTEIISEVAARRRIGVSIAMLSDLRGGVIIQVGGGFMHPRTFLDIVREENTK